MSKNQHLDVQIPMMQYTEKSFFVSSISGRNLKKTSEEIFFFKLNSHLMLALSKSANTNSKARPYVPQKPSKIQKTNEQSWILFFCFIRPLNYNVLNKKKELTTFSFI